MNVSSESSEVRLVELTEYCLTQCDQMQHNKAEGGIHCGVDAERVVKKAITDLLKLGGIELAQELLSEEMSFDDVDEAVKRLARIQQWCLTHPGTNNALHDSPRSAETREVFDKDVGKSVAIDLTDTEHWGPIKYVTYGKYISDDGPEYNVVEDLYRHPTGHWTLLCDRYFIEADVDCVTEANRLNDNDAVDWLLRYGFAPPADVAHISSEVVFRPGMPAGKEEAGQNTHGNSNAKPQWDRNLGKLYLNGAVIRKLRSVSVAKNIVKVLNVFEEEGWPERIDDPLAPPDQQRLHETIKRLNNNLQEIKFRADGNGQGYVWEYLDRPETAPDSSGIPF